MSMHLWWHSLVTRSRKPCMDRIHICSFRLLWIILLPSDPYMLSTFYRNSSSSSELCDQSPAPLAFEGRGCYFTSLFETDLSSAASSLEKYKKMAETQNRWVSYIHELASLENNMYALGIKVAFCLVSFYIANTGYQLWGNRGNNLTYS